MHLGGMIRQFETAGRILSDVQDIVGSNASHTHLEPHGNSLASGFIFQAIRVIDLAGSTAFFASGYSFTLCGLKRVRNCPTMTRHSRVPNRPTVDRNFHVRIESHGNTPACEVCSYLTK